VIGSIFRKTLCSVGGGTSEGAGAGKGSAERADEAELVICLVISFDSAGFRSVHLVCLICPSFEMVPGRSDQSGGEDFVL
jgi:hypothetical protein